MQDPDVNISIKADSSGAITAFDGVAASAGRLDNKVSQLGSKIQKPIGTIGLQLYAQELARSVGLSGAASQGASVLATTLEQAGAAAGVASGGIGLAVAGFIALSAAIYAVFKHSQKQKKSLEDASVEIKKQYDSTVDLSTSIEEYRGRVERLSPTLEALSVATKKVNEQNRFALLMSQGQQLTAIDAMIRKKQELIEKIERNIKINEQEAEVYNGHLEDGRMMVAVNRDLIKEKEKLSQEIDNENKKRIEIKANIEAQAKGYKGLSDMMDKQSRAAEERAKKEADAEKKITDALRREEAYRRRLYTENVNYVKSILSSRYNMELAMMHGVGAQAAVMAQTVEDAYGEAYLSITKGAADSFARMAVDGENFGKNMESAFKNMARSFISAITQMMIRWLAFKAITSVFPGANIVPSSAIPMTAASGLDTVVSRPTMLLVGEGGEDEHVRVTPRSQAQLSAAGASGGRGGNMNFTINNYISGGGNMDVNRLANTIGRQIISRIRGQGDLDFTR